MYHIIEYTELNSRSNSDLWHSPGVFLNVDFLVFTAEHQEGFTFEESFEKNNDWIMKSGPYSFKLKIIQCSFSSLNKKILEFKSKDSIYQFQPIYESYLTETNEVISLHQSALYLTENMKKLMPNESWKIRAFNPINPWQLNIKETLCTP